ncbi:SDR family NAD(P)-dependent oxidoreductase [Algoriphagus kandeliae]|uniref:SDR family NAD(P)-dependent oxidoreductase n=1 Tax=Algoriphagus kandeliae TaxID=2562278 RepID=A0A4Y9QPR9_9BACT|nr:SDR family NAD(P)-dependent oxidoreductase [Algoriphagus kandeliae]TFV93582.1 SDR family NAD(P)-dependent oxidoreductase [Algoriphagus kandeliae]
MKGAFSQKNIIVTGAASGIGKELVRLLYGQKAHILAVDFSEEGLDELEMEFPGIQILKVDLSQKEGNEKILDWVRTHWVRVDVSIANAGKAEYGKAEQQNWREMDQLFQLNVFSPIQLGMELRQQLKENFGRHVIVASAISYWTVPGYSIYAASKSALLQWARTIWKESGGDWLTLVFPIATDTKFFDAAGKSIPKAFPLQKPQKAAEKILKGIIQRKKRIFPSSLFPWMMNLDRFLFLIQPIYQALERKKLEKWVLNNPKNE